MWREEPTQPGGTGPHFMNAPSYRPWAPPLSPTHIWRSRRIAVAPAHGSPVHVGYAPGASVSTILDLWGLEN